MGVEFKNLQREVSGLEVVLGHFSEVNGFADAAFDGIGAMRIRLDRPSFGADRKGGGFSGLGFPQGVADHTGKDANFGFHPDVFSFGGGDFSRKEISFANKVSDHPGMGATINVFRFADLGNFAAFENGHPVGNGEGFFLVVGHVDGREARLFADPTDFGSHFQSEFGVEVRKRFVKKEGAGSDDEGAGEGHALLLASGELGDFAIGVCLHPDRREGLFYPGISFGAGHFAFFQAERDILGDGHVGPERVALEHHPGIALVRREVGDIVVVKENPAFVGDIESGNIAQKGGLSAAAGSEKKENLARFDPESNAI